MEKVRYTPQNSPQRSMQDRKTMAVYLKISNPLVVDAKGKWHYEVTYHGNNYIVRTIVDRFTDSVDSIDVVHAVSTKKETAINLLNASRVQFSGGKSLINGFNHKITDNPDSFNSKFAS